LPSRPRAHELETESRRAFERVLPGAWEDGSPPADYGVDKYVEVFEDGKPTGLIFAVQLKSTDSPIADALRVGIAWRTVNYWTALPVPVLLVRYVASTGVLIATWAHTHHHSFVNDERRSAWFVLDPDRDLLTRENAPRSRMKFEASTPPDTALCRGRSSCRSSTSSITHDPHFNYSGDAHRFRPAWRGESTCVPLTEHASLLPSPSLGTALISTWAQVSELLLRRPAAQEKSSNSQVAALTS
jgi:hypothetical protein